MSDAQLHVPMRAEAIVKSDSTIHDPPYRRIYVGTGGDLVVLYAGDTVAVTYANMPDASFLLGRIQKVMAATTATGLIGEF